VINYLRPLFFLVTGMLTLLAQSEPTAEKPPPAGRSAWFACLAKPQGLENPVTILAGGQITKLELPPFMASAAVKIPQDGILRIVRPIPDPEKPARTRYLVLAEAHIAENIHEALVILNPLPGPEGDLLFSAKVQDLAAFKGGDRLFINLSETNIRVRLGKTTVSVAPARAGVYQSPKLAQPKNMPILYEFYHPARKEWKILTASTVVIRPTRREIIVFNNGTRLGIIKKHGILFPVPP